jgi:DNA replication protein DnaC
MLERTRLLDIADWGPEALNAEQRRDLLEIVDDRYEKGSLLVTSQIPVKRWHELVGDPTIGDAILDRVVHRAHRIELDGPSLRDRTGVTAAAKSGSAAAAK